MASNSPQQNTTNQQKPGNPARKQRRWSLRVAAVVFALIAASALIVQSSDANEAFVYAKRVEEALAQRQNLQGRRIRVEGKLLQGSVVFREEPCEWRFTIGHEKATLPVRYPQCVVPDTFRDDMGISVTVEGSFEGNEFLASQVLAKCPSKYEMKQKQQAGENAPHAMPTENAMPTPDAAPGLDTARIP